MRRHASKTQRIAIDLKGHELVLGIFFVFSVLLIVFPEFFYFKDIYPAHFRSNTMFKLGYQAFILFSIVSGYTIVSAVGSVASKTQKWQVKAFLLLLIPQLFLVLIYPLFSVRSYFNSLKEYKGLDGLSWLREQYPDNHAAISWLNESAKNNLSEKLPVIVEADGDSYTDHAQVSAFTGLPSIIGWPVHEWLWRGTYDVVAPRREDVRRIYESTSQGEVEAILAQYDVSYIVVGPLERQKYTNLHDDMFLLLGDVVFTQGATTIYRVGIDR